MSRIRKLTLSAVLSALTVALLYAASLLPMVRIAITAAAGITTAVAVIRCSLGWGVGVYAVSGLLALLLLPDKGTAVWYLLVFGHYGLLKSLIERLNRQVLEWVLKVAVFALTAGAMCLFFREFFLAALPDKALWLLLPVLVLCLVAYDIAFSALIHVYERRIKPHTDK